MIPAAVLAGLALVVWLLVIPWIKRGPRGEIFIGVLWRILRVHVAIVHRIRYHGLKDFRLQPESGPLVVVSNHTGAVDPLLIQAGCRFSIRWMMASEMISPALGWLWKLERPIPVDRAGKDSKSAREAIRHVQSGGALGIFPEGRIVRPPRQIRPFHPGVGLIVSRTKAPVLLIWVSGTPDTDVMSKSVLTPSRAKVEYIELINFKEEDDAHEITRKLRQRLAKVTGWPLNDEQMPMNGDGKATRRESELVKG